MFITLLVTLYLCFQVWSSSFIKESKTTLQCTQVNWLLELIVSDVSFEHFSTCLSNVVRLLTVRLHKKQYKDDFFSILHFRWLEDMCAHKTNIRFVSYLKYAKIFTVYKNILNSLIYFIPAIITLEWSNSFGS